MKRGMKGSMDRMDRAMQCYLKGRELHLMYTPAANARARALFEEAIKLDDTFHRAKGHLAYSRLHAWLYGWDAINLTTQVRDLAWSAVYRTGHPQTTEHDGAQDYDNWWSVGVALLYYAAHGVSQAQRNQTFNDSIEHYQRARTKAWPDEKDPATMVAIKEDMADLLADYADALCLRGDANDVQDALALLDKAKELSAGNHPKWHDWVRAWAYYERGEKFAQRAPAESEAAYLSAIDLLRSLPTLPNQYRRTLAACYAALGWNDDARREGRKFLRHEREQGRPYDPAIENRWAYKDPVKHARLRERLRKAGLPAPV